MFLARQLVSRNSALIRKSTSLSSNPVLARVLSAASSTESETPTPPHPSESFASGTNSHVLENLFEQWQQDRNAVDASWQKFFEVVESDQPPGSFTPPPRMSKFAATAPAGTYSAEDSVKLFKFIRSYRVLGHFTATLDPLGISKSQPDLKHEYLDVLDLASYGFTEADLDREFFIGNELPGKPVRTLREVRDLLQAVYGKHIGSQFMHIHSPRKKAWIQERLETKPEVSSEKPEKIEIYKWLIKASLFENFLDKKYNTKRFGLDGGEALIPGLEALLQQASRKGIKCVVFGMPHRGRLNVLANVMQKPLPTMFNEFHFDNPEIAASVEGTGDVKYHLGTSNNRTMLTGEDLHLSMTANPSHLEAVNPVVEGKTRAKQTLPDGSLDRNRAMSVLIHGDAAFAGQGIVGETLELGGLQNFSTGGTIHVIVNNQIGFTTVPKYARACPYPSELAKANGAPIFHVNGDDPEAVIHVFKLAVDYRNEFGKDAVIDMYCYRRFGHNELDEPRFTQPLMYAAIEKHPKLLDLYEKKLVSEGVLSKKEAKEFRAQYVQELEDGFKAKDNYKQMPNEWLEARWKGFKSREQLARIRPTGVSESLLTQVGTGLTTIPSEFKIHRKRVTDLKHKAKTIADGKGLDWALGEALAYGTLLAEGFNVRLCGQDCERGTFSHRHAVLYCQETENSYTPLKNLGIEGQGNFNVINSNLSELAVLGFELGYSLEDPNTLNLWEAQFGDFANGAQIIFDQFISSGEQKWQRMSGLVLLLPHGYEGMGPEHSSARLERYLQACDDDPYTFPENEDRLAQNINMQVVNCTTPASFFHVLRRQLHREYRKPLVVMTPKRALQLRRCQSNIEDFADGSTFKPVLADENPNIVADDKVKKLVFCSGNVYWDLTNARDIDIPQARSGEDARGKKQLELKGDPCEQEVAICRVEQIAPFPYSAVKEQIEKYPNAEVCWAQEEHLNMGAWSYVEPRLETAGDNKFRPKYIGRGPSAATATGVTARHRYELQQILFKIFGEFEIISSSK